MPAIPITKRRKDALAGTRIDPTSPQADKLAYAWNPNFGDDVRVPNQSSFNNHHGIWSGTSVNKYSAGPPRLGGKAAKLTVAGADYLDCGDVYNDTQFDKHITYMCWLLFTDNDNTYKYAITTGPGRGFYIAKARSGWNSGKVHSKLSLNTTNVTLFDDALPIVDKWYHAAVTWSYSSSNVKFYIDGRLVDETSTGIGEFNLFGSNFYIGFNESLYYEGSISDVRLYGKKLASEEVNEVYNNGQSLYKTDLRTTSFIPGAAPPATRITFPIIKRRKDALAGTRIDPTKSDGLVGLWDYNYSDNNKCYDQSAYGNHQSWVNTPGYKNYASVGQAAVIRDSTSYLQASSKNVFTSGEPWTLCFWLNVLSLPSFSGICGNEFAGGKYTRVYFTNSRFMYINTDANTSKPFDIRLAELGEHFYVLSYDGNIARSYFDGSYSSATDPITGTFTFYRFGNNGSTTYPLDGDMADMRIYSYALNEAEAYEYYARKLPYRSDLRTTTFIPGAVPPTVNPTPWHLFNISY